MGGGIGSLARAGSGPVRVLLLETKETVTGRSRKNMVTADPRKSRVAVSAGWLALLSIGHKNWSGVGSPDRTSARVRLVRGCV